MSTPDVIARIIDALDGIDCALSFIVSWAILMTVASAALYIRILALERDRRTTETRDGSIPRTSLKIPMPAGAMRPRPEYERNPRVQPPGGVESPLDRG